MTDHNQGNSVGKIAVGVMMGIAGYTVIASLVQHILLPPLGYVIRETEFAELSFELPVEGDDPVEIKYGLFLTALVSLVVLLVVVWLSRWLGNKFFNRDD